MSELTPEEIAKIRAEAKKQIAEEQRKALVAAALETALEEERIARGLAPKKGAPVPKSMDSLTIELPEFSPCIVLDGQKFYPGFTYTVSSEQAQTLRDIMARAKRHDDEIHGRWFDNYRRPRRVVLSHQGRA